MKDIDGARSVQFEMVGDSVFMIGRGFEYEFDKGVFAHQILKLVNWGGRERVPLGGGTLCPTPCERLAQA